MKNKTEQYIILKPISERFNKITNKLSDVEIKELVISTLKEKIQDELNSIDFGYTVQEIIEKYVEDSKEDIVKMIKSSITNKFN